MRDLQPDFSCSCRWLLVYSGYQERQAGPTGLVRGSPVVCAHAVGRPAATACLPCCTASQRWALAGIAAAAMAGSPLHALGVSVACQFFSMHLCCCDVTRRPSAAQLWRSPAVASLFVAWSLAEVSTSMMLRQQIQTWPPVPQRAVATGVSDFQPCNCVQMPQVVRYPWYAASLAGGSPGWLTWARYTAFLPLYPVIRLRSLMFQLLPRSVDAAGLQHSSYVVTPVAGTASLC